MKHVVPPQILSSIAVFLLATSGMLSAQQNITYSQGRSEHPDWVQVPGELIRPDCVHEIPNGATVEVGNDGQVSGDVMLNGVLIAHYEDCPEAPIITRPTGFGEALANDPGTGNGWVEASNWLVSLNSGDNLDEIAGDWNVPSDPKTNGALIYLFNGMEPSNFKWILQPVLQYGVGAAGGGNYWGIASWLVGSKAYHSPLEKVNPKDSLRGYTIITSVSGGTIYWKVDAKDNTTGAYSYLDANTHGLQWTWALAGVLEVYGVTSCSEFPSNGQAVFTKSDAYHGYPKFELLSPADWQASYWSYGGPSCGFNVNPGTTSTLKF
jgi:hypothetical protein